jgi:hypothetical protein
MCLNKQDFVDFSGIGPFFPFDWRIVQTLRQRRGKTTNRAPATLSSIQAASQSTFFNEQIYSTCDEQEERKLALTAINKLFALYNHQWP